MLAGDRTPGQVAKAYCEHGRFRNGCEEHIRMQHLVVDHIIERPLSRDPPQEPSAGLLGLQLAERHEVARRAAGPAHR